ncbi:MAG: drug/metabolite transporter (DMT)-like permease [Parasphingorhabdus sp.]|jgi:drug/metabolite transporter (DMT)-like permease
MSSMGPGIQFGITRGVLLMLMGCALLTANDAMMKSLVSSLPLGQVLAMRGIFALGGVLLLAPWVGGYQRMRANRHRNVLLCSGLLVFNLVLFPMSLPYMPLADAIILAYTSPIWVVAMAPLLLAERVNWQQWAAVLIGFAGACLVIKPGVDSFNWAVVLPLIVAVVVGLRDIVTRKIASGESALSIVAYTNVLVIVVGMAMFPLGWESLNREQLFLLAICGVFFSISQLMMVVAFRSVEVTVLSTFKYSSILYAALLGYWFWGDVLGLRALIGAIFIVISGLVIVRYRHKPLVTGSEVLPRVARPPE